MRCTHCGYHSFDKLSTCKKCGKPLLARYSPADSPLTEEPPQLFTADELKKRADLVPKTIVPLPGLSPLGAKTSRCKPRQEGEQMALPSFLLEDPHQTTNNWDGWRCGDGDEGFQGCLWRRFWATLMDVALIALIWSLFVWLSCFVMRWTFNAWLVFLEADPLGRLAYYLLTMLLIFSYFFLSHYASGQTPGKVLVGLRVVSVDGEPLSFSQVVLRSTGTVLSLLCFGLGFVATLRDEEQRGWSDRLAGTRIVDACENHMEPLPHPERERSQ